MGRNPCSGSSSFAKSCAVSEVRRFPVSQLFEKLLCFLVPAKTT